MAWRRWSSPSITYKWRFICEKQHEAPSCLCWRPTLSCTQSLHSGKSAQTHPVRVRELGFRFYGRNAQNHGHLGMAILVLKTGMCKVTSAIAPCFVAIYSRSQMTAHLFLCLAHDSSLLLVFSSLHQRKIEYSCKQSGSCSARPHPASLV